MELNNDGTETPVQQYKAAGFLKRQGARFQVWEYELSPTGDLIPVEEVQTPAHIEWTVSLVNAKAAGNKIAPVVDGSRKVLLPVGPPRNDNIADRESLIIRGGTCNVGGIMQPPVMFDKGSFLGKQVYLGELFTDRKGRLIILGGKGKSVGIPTAPGEPIPSLGHFANNERWHDDVSDGPVTARITLPGEAPVDALPAWIICAPPDFAPAASTPVSLYEVAIQAAISRGWVTPNIPPSFVSDVFPILSRALSLRWVHDWVYWSAITDNWAALSSLTDQAARLTAFNQIVQAPLHEYALPSYLNNILVDWRDGNFINDFGQMMPKLTIPEACDRAALEACIATSFFPGIEAGFAIANPALYMEPFRLSHQQVLPGQLTAQMAVPWQADFNDCAEDWWPSQRPVDVFSRETDIPNGPARWDEGIYETGDAPSRKRMVDSFGKLGVIVPDNSGQLLESERDGSLPQH